MNNPTTCSTQSPLKRAMERLGALLPSARLLAGMSLAALAAMPCRADPRGTTIIGTSEDGLRVVPRKIIYRWHAGAVAADPAACARAALAALRRNPGLHRGERKGDVIWAQSDITTVLAWCVPREAGADATLFTIAAGPDNAEVERFDLLPEEAGDFIGIRSTQDGFENRRRNTPGAKPGEKALTVAWADARRPSNRAACEQAAGAEAKQLLSRIRTYPALVSGSSPNGRAFIACFGDGDGTRLWFATFGTTNDAVASLNNRLMDATLSRLDKEARPVMIRPDMNMNRFP